MAGLRRSSKKSFQPPDNVPSRGQQPPTPTINSFGRSMLPPPEAPGRFARIARGRPVVLLHGSTKPLSQARVLASATGPGPQHAWPHR
ncbi:hypothetical protein CRENBAI_018629, partial [Crenichthys baileyi]